MKVTISKESKDALKVSQLSAARYVIACNKDDEMTAKDYAKYAVNAISYAYDIGYIVEILKVSAYVMPNCNVWEWYGENSDNLDVWIEGIAECSDGFCKFGAFLSDICGLDSSNGAWMAKNRMYSKVYVSET